MQLHEHQTSKGFLALIVYASIDQLDISIFPRLVLFVAMTWQGSRDESYSMVFIISLQLTGTKNHQKISKAKETRTQKKEKKMFLLTSVLTFKICLATYRIEFKLTNHPESKCFQRHIYSPITLNRSELSWINISISLSLAIDVLSALSLESIANTYVRV